MISEFHWKINQASTLCFCEICQELSLRKNLKELSSPEKKECAGTWYIVKVWIGVKKNICIDLFKAFNEKKNQTSWIWKDEIFSDKHNRGCFRDHYHDGLAF